MAILPLRHKTTCRYRQPVQLGDVMREVMRRVGLGATRAWLAIGLLSGSLAVSAATPDAAATQPEDGVQRRVMSFGGLQRSYRWHRPPQSAPGGAVVFVLHGSNGDGPLIRENVGRRLEVLGDAAGFHVVYPDGFERHWNDCRGTATYAANRLDVDDPGFLRAILAVLRTEAGVDPRRVFVMGMSNGGQMVLRLAFEDAATYAGFAAIVANLPAPATNDCRLGEESVPIALFVGTADPINPFHGGLVRIGNDVSRGHVLDARYTAAWFARRAGHGLPPRERMLPDLDARDGSRAERIDWADPGRPPVVLYVLHGAGHSIPGTPLRPGAPGAVTNRDIDAAREAFRFFQRR